MSDEKADQKEQSSLGKVVSVSHSNGSDQTPKFSVYLSEAIKQREMESKVPVPGEEDALDAELTPDEKERLNASRALKSASWAACFYLITTDILGPFNGMLLRAFHRRRAAGPAGA